MSTTAVSPETPQERNARMAWWREARFGMFIHWGLYAVPAGTWNGQRIGGIGEWIMNNGDIPVADYARFATQFNPTNFNADQWVSIAKNAGMKYIVITSKHHDGFAMFHSQVDDYNIYDATPFHRDPLKELAAACRKQGIKLGFYYSQAQDWHHPGGLEIRRAGRTNDWWDTAQIGSYDDYLKNVSVPQVREILSNYGPLAVLWFDTPSRTTPAQADLFKPLLALQPGLIVNDRLGGGFRGDTSTPEQTIPANGIPGRDWETCMTINDTWGYKSYDTNFKSSGVLIRNLIDIASKGGNYLLNVGPTATGVIPEPEVQRLQDMGAWLKANGEAIYGSSASPFPKQLGWGRCTQKNGRLYLSVFNWPADGKLLVPMLNRNAQAWLLTKPGQKLSSSAGADGLTIQLPTAAPDPVASVLVINPGGPLETITIPSPRQAQDGSLRLMASQAEIVGSTAQLEGGDIQNIGYWTAASDSVRWPAEINQPGNFDVTLQWAIAPEAAGSQIRVSVGAESVTGVTESTGSWSNYRDVKLGSVHITKPGQIMITIRATRAASAVMNLRSVTLTHAP